MDSMEELRKNMIKDPIKNYNIADDTSNQLSSSGDDEFSNKNKNKSRDKLMPNTSPFRELLPKKGAKYTQNFGEFDFLNSDSKISKNKSKSTNKKEQETEVYKIKNVIKRNMDLMS